MYNETDQLIIKPHEIDRLRQIDFGQVEPQSLEINFRDEMNAALLQFTQELPQPIRSDALTFLMDFEEADDGQPFELFSKFPLPTWSPIWWLKNRSRRVDREHLRIALSGQMLVLFLHALDADLARGRIAPNHMILHFRTYCWKTFEQRCQALARDVDGGRRLITESIEAYLASVHHPDDFADQEDYFSSLRHHGATIALIPALIARIHTDDEEIQQALALMFESYNLSAGLLRDLQFFGDDAFRGRKQAVYYLLEETERGLWIACKGHPADHLPQPFEYKNLFHELQQAGILTNIHNRICDELEQSAIMAGKAGLIEVSEELQQMLDPLLMIHFSDNND